MKEIDLTSFERNLVTRNLKIEDYDSVVSLQIKCFPNMKPWSKDQFLSQISIFPEGQVCLEYQNTIVASSSSLILDFSLYSEYHSWKEIADDGFIRNHIHNGNTLYGIEIMGIAMRKLSEFTPLYLKLFTKLSLKYNVNIIGGSHFTIEEENLYNISYLFSPNIETVVIDDIDLELLKRQRQTGTVVNLADRRKDLYEVRYIK